jgi:hypothetical protein
MLSPLRRLLLVSGFVLSPLPMAATIPTFIVYDGLAILLAATLSLFLTACSRCPSSSKSCGDVCLASGATCGGCSSACGSGQYCISGRCLGTQVATLTYGVQDAKYSLALDRLILASAPSPTPAAGATLNEVHVYDPRTGDDTPIPLPASLPVPNPIQYGSIMFLALSPDGRRAVVVNGTWAVYVDLVSATVIAQWEGPAEAEIFMSVAVGNDGYAYVFDNNSNCYSLSLSTGVFQPLPERGYGGSLFLSSYETASPDGATIYFLTAAHAPYEQDLLSSAGALGGQLGDVTSSTAGTCGTPWVSRDGSRIFTGCGPTFGPVIETPAGPAILAGPVLPVPPAAADDIPLDDPPIFGLDDPSSGSPVAAVGLDPHAASQDDTTTALALYDPSTLALQTTIPSPLIAFGGVSHPSIPRWVFYDAAGTTRFELVFANENNQSSVWGIASF